MSEERTTENGNRLIAALPEEEYARLAPHLSRVRFEAQQVLYELDQVVEYLYFPETALVSLLNVLSDGTTVEVGVVGTEGLVGIWPLLGGELATTQALVQIGGQALRVRADLLKEEFRRGGLLQTLLLRYTRTLMMQIAQTAACNSLHNVDQRLARWLVMAKLRVESDKLPLKQEFIAHMLGTRRAGISEAASLLQDAGLIRYSRGHIMILDFKGLEDASCECYQIVRREIETIFNEDYGAK